ncbi:MAG: class I SAM-dependent methyltransferase [Opitutaceae bacterium]|nr:class I SAM-dependent methyltransferase [Opitutaceae bacterium]
MNLRLLRNRIRRLTQLADAAETPVHFSKYIAASSPTGATWNYEAVGRDSPLPIPPRDLWLGYGNNEEEFVSSGYTDVARMAAILLPLGLDLASPNRPILDLGCGGGRMIRHLRSAADHTEVWGLDISAHHIGWLKTHLSPPFGFAVNTTIPHLPFSDGHFGCIYSGSVFTHIDDLAESWFLEVRRVLAPGGLFYCTLHDDHTRERLLAEPEHPLALSLRNHPYLRRDLTPPDIVITGQTYDSNVYYRERYLRVMLGPMFEIAAIVPGAYGYQTAWVLRKR